MAKTKETVSFSKIDELIKANRKEVNPLSYIVGDETINIIVKPSISNEEVSQIVEHVVNGVFIEDENFEIMYMPQYIDILFANGIVRYYTNIKDGLDTDRLNYLMYETSIYDKVISVIDCSQLDSIEAAIEEGISFRKQMMLSQEKKLLQDNLNKLEQYMDMFGGFLEQFKDIDPKDVMKMFKSIAKKDESKIAKAVLNES